MHGKVDLVCVAREDIIESGEIIGIYAFLTGRYKNYSKVVPPVELIWLDIHKLKNITAKDAHLREMFAEHLEHETHERQDEHRTLSPALYVNSPATF